MNYQDLLHSPLIPSRLVSLIEKASRNTAPLLIQGEEGTGKELIAKIIHHTGDWKPYPFYKLDCKFLSDDALHAQLSRSIREINYGSIPGTFFLKGMEHLGKVNQLRLLEILNDGIFLDGSEKRPIQNVRFISSATENIRARVAELKFSEDLYDRLSTLSLSIPPLRERNDEIPAISEHILAEHAKKLKIKKVGISEEALRVLRSYWWPGNLKEFEHVIVRSAILSEGDNLTERDLHFEIENEKDSFLSFLRKAEETKPPPEPKKRSGEEPTVSPTPLFFIELVHRIKNPLVSIKTFTQLLASKFNDPEFREYFYRIVTEDIEKIDSVLDGLLNYIKINTPINKVNTIHSILEETIKKYEGRLEEKKIKVYKKFEKDLPETVVHDEQLRYVLDSLVHYAIPSIPPYGSIGFLTKSVFLPKGPGNHLPPLKQNGRYIEVIVAFTGYKKPMEQFENVLGIPTLQREEVIELELRLIREIIHRNHGWMTFDVDEKKPRTFISLKFPIERRRVIYYQPTHP